MAPLLHLLVGWGGRSVGATRVSSPGGGVVFFVWGGEVEGLGGGEGVGVGLFCFFLFGVLVVSGRGGGGRRRPTSLSLSRTERELGRRPRKIPPPVARSLLKTILGAP